MSIRLNLFFFTYLFLFLYDASSGFRASYVARCIFFLSGHFPPIFIVIFRSTSKYLPAAYSYLIISRY